MASETVLKVHWTAEMDQKLLEMWPEHERLYNVSSDAFCNHSLMTMTRGEGAGGCFLFFSSPIEPKYQTCLKMVGAVPIVLRADRGGSDWIFEPSH